MFQARVPVHLLPDEGLCQFWSLLYLVWRLEDLNKTTDETMKKIHKLSDGQLADIMINFIAELERKKIYLFPKMQEKFIGFKRPPSKSETK